MTRVPASSIPAIIVALPPGPNYGRAFACCTLSPVIHDKPRLTAAYLADFESHLAHADPPAAAGADWSAEPATRP